MKIGEEKMVIRKKVITGLLASAVSFCVSGLSCQGMEIDRDNLFVPQRLATTSCLRFSAQQFNIVLDGENHAIKSYNVRGLPSSLTQETIEGFLNAKGYFSVGKAGEDYMLTANLRLHGGSQSQKQKQKQMNAAKQLDVINQFNPFNNQRGEPVFQDYVRQQQQNHDLIDEALGIKENPKQAAKKKGT